MAMHSVHPLGYTPTKFSKKGWGGGGGLSVPQAHFMYDFSREVFLICYSIN